MGVKDLLNNRNLLITRPDKGSGIVIMNRSECVDKIESLLADTTKFQQLNNDVDKTVSIERNINFLLKTLQEKSILSNQICNDIKPIGTRIPRLYGLPKIHKPNVPFDPFLICPLHHTIL